MMVGGESSATRRWVNESEMKDESDLNCKKGFSLFPEPQSNSPEALSLGKSKNGYLHTQDTVITLAFYARSGGLKH